MLWYGLGPLTQLLTWLASHCTQSTFTSQACTWQAEYQPAIRTASSDAKIAGQMSYKMRGYGRRGPTGTSPAVGAVLDAVAETEAEAWAESVSDAELDELAGRGGEAGFDAWLDGLDDDQFRAIRDEGAGYGGRELDYLHAVHRMDAALANSAQREHDWQAQDADAPARRPGSRHRRPSDEIILSNALDHFSRGTCLPGQLDMANGWGGGSPDLDGLLGRSSATPLDVMEEMRYQMGTRAALPSARTRREPLPYMSRRWLARPGLIW
jgi:hypothetical protein